MNKSESIKELAAALALAQAEIQGAAKDAENPHYGSKYADLASVWAACRGPLSKNGLAVIQMPGEAVPHEHGPSTAPKGWLIPVSTMLVHKSGEWIERTFTVAAANSGAQAFVAAVTYGRRCGLAAFAGVAPEDDDGEAAEGRGPEPKRARKDTADRAAGRKALQAAKAAPGAPNGADDALGAARRRAYALLQRIAVLELGEGVSGTDLLDSGDAGHFARETYRRKLMGAAPWSKDKAEDMNGWADAMQAVLEANEPPLEEAPPPGVSQ